MCVDSLGIRFALMKRLKEMGFRVVLIALDEVEQEANYVRR